MTGGRNHVSWSCRTIARKVLPVWLLAQVCEGLDQQHHTHPWRGSMSMELICQLRHSLVLFERCTVQVFGSPVGLCDDIPRTTFKVTQIACRRLLHQEHSQAGRVDFQAGSTCCRQFCPRSSVPAKQGLLTLPVLQCVGETSLERVCTFRHLVMYNRQFFYISEGQQKQACIVIGPSSWSSLQHPMTVLRRRNPTPKDRDDLED